MDKIIEELKGLQGWLAEFGNYNGGLDGDIAIDYCTKLDAIIQELQPTATDEETEKEFRRNHAVELARGKFSS